MSTSFNERQPARVGDMLDTTFSLLRRHIKSLLVIASIVMVPYTIVSTVLFPLMTGTPLTVLPTQELSATIFASRGLTVYFAFFLIAYLYFLPWMFAALVINCSSIITGRTSLHWRDAYRRARPRIGSVLITSILMGIVVAIGIFLLVIPGIIFAIWFAVAMTAAVLDNIRGAEALKRSRELVKGHFWTIVGFSILIYIVSFLLSLIVGFIIALGAVFGNSSLLMVTVTALTQLATNLIVYAFSFLATTVLYYKLREHHEGFDLMSEADRIIGSAGTSV